MAGHFRFRRWSLLLAIGAGLATLWPLPTMGASHQGSPLDIGAVDAFVRRELDRASIPGAALAITRDGTVVHVRGFGRDSDNRPVTGETLFRIASLSKSFTSLAVMQLVEAGTLNLDDSVASHLPEFRLSDPRGADITVRQLLDQTSGLADREVRPMSTKQPGTLTEAVRRLRSARLVADPGTEWNYHNPNYQVAARLVEVRSGETFDQYLRRHIFEPAGMTHSSSTSFYDEPVADLAEGHVTAYGLSVVKSPPHVFTAGDGGIVASGHDLARWLVVHTNRGVAESGVRLLSRRGVVQMHTASAPGGYALGWDTIGPAAAPTKVEHSGTVLTFSAIQAILPNSGYGVGLLYNASSALLGEQTAILNGVLDIVEGRDLNPDGATISSSTMDYLLAVLSLAVLVLGLSGATRARVWVAKHAGSPLRMLLGLLPHLGVFAFVAMFPRLLGSQIGGRDVTWSSAAYGWFALLLLVLLMLAASLATVAFRVWHLVRLYLAGRASPSPAHEEDNRSRARRRLRRA